MSDKEEKRPGSRVLGKQLPFGPLFACPKKKRTQSPPKIFKSGKKRTLPEKWAAFTELKNIFDGEKKRALTKKELDLIKNIYGIIIDKTKTSSDWLKKLSAANQADPSTFFVLDVAEKILTSLLRGQKKNILNNTISFYIVFAQEVCELLECLKTAEAIKKKEDLKEGLTIFCKAKGLSLVERYLLAKPIMLEFTSGENLEENGLLEETRHYMEEEVSQGIEKDTENEEALPESEVKAKRIR